MTRIFEIVPRETDFCSTCNLAFIIVLKVQGE